MMHAIPDPCPSQRLISLHWDRSSLPEFVSALRKISEFGSTNQLSAWINSNKGKLKLKVPIIIMILIHRKVS